MTMSLPSKEIYSVDIPEVENFTGEFQYNFFVPDESTLESGGTSAKFLTRKSDQIDSSFIQYATTRAPRFIIFRWKLPRLATVGNLVSEQNRSELNFSSNSQKGSLISSNVAKIVTEDQFASNNFIAVNFHDGEIDNKIHYFVSSSYEMQTLGEKNDENLSLYKSAHKFSANTPKSIKPHFLYRSMTSPSLGHGTRYFTKQGKRIFNDYYQKLKEVSIKSQINSKLFYDVTNRMIKDPHSQFASDVQSINKFAKKVQQNSLKRSLHVTDDDFKTFVPFIDIRIQKSSNHYGNSSGEIVGYIIDKSEISVSGQTRAHPSIIVENSKVNTTADFKVKYGSMYSYTIRTIMLFTIPAVDNDSGDVAMIKVLVSSKPSNNVYVNTSESISPPPPSDVNFTWDYDRENPTTQLHDFTTGEKYPGTGRKGGLMVHWMFPTNSQRDIKKFQVFRRKSTDHPFELIKMYDFNDSEVQHQQLERVDRSLVEITSSPVTFFYDDEFLVEQEQNNSKNRSPDKTNSSQFIYAIASIDAHGMTSNFSAQYEIWFDIFKNKLQKKLISHSGAPKPYPNLYLEADTFVDTMHVGGPHSKRLKVYFNPEFYYLTDDKNRTENVFATNQTNGKYVLQFINTDNQKSANVEITIDDQLTQTKKTNNSEIDFGKKSKTL